MQLPEDQMELLSDSQPTFCKNFKFWWWCLPLDRELEALLSGWIPVRYYFPPSYAPSSRSLFREGQMPIVEGHQNAARALPLAFLMRMVVRISRARWFGFLRRVFQYQNGSRSDLVSNPFNSKPWLALEFVVLVSQIVVITVTMAVSQKENPVWPLRIWLAGYNLGNLLSLPLLYWRYRHSNISHVSDLEHQLNTEESRSSHLMNKSRTLLELFFAIWFVMGNVWIFDARFGSLDRAPKLHVLCLILLAWNAISYSFPFLLFMLLCCCVPFISNMLGYNMNLASADKGAYDDQISKLPHWQFKRVEPMNETLSENSVSQECCICLAKYKEREEVRQLPCSHLFHLRCVDQWLRIISSCPLCKQELEKWYIREPDFIILFVELYVFYNVFLICFVNIFFFFFWVNLIEI